MDLMQPHSALEPLLILMAWTAVLSLLALAFVVLLRWARQQDEEEAVLLLELLGSAEQALEGFKARERAHLQEITRLRHRLADIEGQERAA